MRNLSKVIVFVWTVAPLVTMAGEGTTIGNGGDVYLDSGKTYVLDMVEAGLLEGPELWLPKNGQKISMKVNKVCDSKKLCFDILDTSDSLLLKLIQNRSPVFKDDMRLAVSLVNIIKTADSVQPALAKILQKQLLENEWIVADLTLKEISDAVTVVDSSKLLQGVINRNGVIRMSEDAWTDGIKKGDVKFKRLDDWNRLALVVHEIVYAETFQQGDRTSERARQITGLIMSSSESLQRMNAAYALLTLASPHSKSSKKGKGGQVNVGLVSKLSADEKVKLLKHSQKVYSPESENHEMQVVYSLLVSGLFKAKDLRALSFNDSKWEEYCKSDNEVNRLGCSIVEEYRLQKAKSNDDPVFSQEQVQRLRMPVLRRSLGEDLLAIGVVLPTQNRKMHSK